MTWIAKSLGALNALGPRGRVTVAAYVSPAASALACIRQGGTAGATIELRADPLSRVDDLESMLRRQLQSFGLRRQTGQLVLSPEFYKLLLVETPAVPQEEVNDALRWQLQEGADFDIADAAIDSFPMPSAGNRGAPMTFAAAAPNAELRQLVEAAGNAGFKVHGIDIVELALRNLMCRLYDAPDQAFGVLRITASGGVFTLSRGDQLFLARRLNGVPDALDDAAWTTFKERLLVQLQRSVDYYESALGQPPASGLFVAATDGREADIIRFLTEMLPFPVRSLPTELSRAMDIRLHNPEPVLLRPDAMDQGLNSALASALPALGGVLSLAGAEAA